MVRLNNTNKRIEVERAEEPDIRRPRGIRSYYPERDDPEIIGVAPRGELLFLRFLVLIVRGVGENGGNGGASLTYRLTNANLLIHRPENRNAYITRMTSRHIDSPLSILCYLEYSYSTFTDKTYPLLHDYDHRHSSPTFTAGKST